MPCAYVKWPSYYGIDTVSITYQQQKDKLILEMKILTLQVLGPTFCGFFLVFVFIWSCSQLTVQSKKLRGTLIDHSPDPNEGRSLSSSYFANPDLVPLSWTQVALFLCFIHNSHFDDYFWSSRRLVDRLWLPLSDNLWVDQRRQSQI